MTEKVKISKSLIVRILPVGSAVLNAMILFFVMEIANRNADFMRINALNILINIGTYFALIMALWIITGKWGIGCGVISLVFAILGIINLYSLEFREMPISTRDIYNATAAWNVLKAYEITLNKRVIFLFGMCFLLVTFSVFLWRFERKRKQESRKKILVGKLGGLIGIVLFFYCCYFGQNSIIPKCSLGWTWTEPYYSYGFMATSIQIARQTAYKIEKPAGFEEERLEKCRKELAGIEGTQSPDIVLILNESWYDFSLISEMETNEAVSPFIDSLENCIRGYAVVPMIGGGTHSSEYELLTGNSMQLLQGITPFNTLDMEDEATVVTVLEEQGYETTVFHPASGSSYSRSIGFPAMGFDHIYFANDVEGLEYWMQRTSFATDKSNFALVRDMYENNLSQGEKPQFIYNLTIQNHGGYAQVSITKVPLKVISGLENMDEQSMYEINEYLSCVNMTDQAFEELVAYYEKNDRPVIICMVGDHCPVVAEKYVNRDITEEERLLYLHSTPFVIWSNWGLEEKDMGFIGMPYLMPLLLQAAGVDQPPYYQYMVDNLMDNVPVLTSFGVYLDKEGTQYSYTDQSEYSEMIDQYLYMEYWNLTGNKEDVLFSINK